MHNARGAENLSQEEVVGREEREGELPLLASKVSNRLRPSEGLEAAALRARFASSSFWAASQASSRSMGCSFVPPETKPEDIAGCCCIGGCCIRWIGRAGSWSFDGGF